MAWNSGAADIASSRRDSKLEIFLKQKLSEGVFERIRAYEACVAQSRKVKRNFKFVILSDERIYITDNPPKTIRNEESVFLGDVTSIKLVNEFPDFLSGDDRENSQHICVKYKCVVPLSRSRLNLLNKLSSGSSSSSGKIHKKNGPKGDQRAKSNPSSGTSSPSPAVKERAGEVQEQKRTNRGMRLHRSFDESDLELLRAMNDDDDSLDGEEEDRMSLSCPTPELRNLAAIGRSDSDHLGSSSSSRSSSSSSSGLQLNTRVKSVETCRPLPQRPPSNRGDAAQSINTPDTLATHFAATLGHPDQTAHKSSPYRTLPSPDVIDDARKKPFLFTTGKPSRRIEKDTNGNEKPWLVEPNSDSSTRSSLQDENEEKTEEIEEELHLYLLTLSSPFLMHLRSSWNNYIVRSTLLKDPKQAKRMGTRKNNQARLPSRETLERQFQQLKNEIMNSANSMPNLFQLVQELCNAAEKYFVLKKLFWKCEDLFAFLITQLHRYLPKSQLTLQTNEKGNHHRADELELAILLIESLGLMFRETEMVAGRLTTVKANNGKAVLDLVIVLTCFPEVPQRWRPPRTKAHSLLLETDADSWETYEDAEVFNLVKELTDASTTVLFELILIAHQANWGNAEGKFFNICWLMKVLESLQTTTYKFVERLISRAMRYLMPSSNEKLTPAQAVLLFQQFFVLQTLIQYSSSFTAHVRNNYTEEFKYYIQSPHILDKLPGDYPITKITLQLIEEVIGHVLQKRTTLQASS